MRLISWIEKPKKNTTTPNMMGSSLQRLQEVRRKALDYKPTAEYTPTNNFVYDSNSLNTLQDKANRLLFDSRF